MSFLPRVMCGVNSSRNPLTYPSPHWGEGRVRGGFPRIRVRGRLSQARNDEIHTTYVATYSQSI